MPSVSSLQGPAIWLPRTPKTFAVETLSLKKIRYLITGVTRNSSGVAIGNVSIEALEAITANTSEPKGRLVGTTISDANGNYSIEVHADPAVKFQIDAYKAGAPDVAGTTVNTLVPVAT